MAERNFQLSSGSTCEDSQLPSNFTVQRLLGVGTFGKVFQCFKKDTKQTVAVKIPSGRGERTTEVPMMEMLMLQNLDQQNIVQFIGWFPTSFGKAMVFESLDISLEGFIQKRRCAPMQLSDIRDMIEQLATAFNALKQIGVIHTDLKLDNVMMVDHRRRPYRVKLIDFGMALHRSKARQGTTMQVPCYRAPEIILGLPFSEAIDMWSLGCVMAVMLHGGELFPGDNEYEVLLEINSLLGLPCDRVLDEGLKTKLHFKRTESGSWTLRSHHEYGGNQRKYKPLTNTMDGFRKRRLDNRFEAVQRPMCIDLLEAMVKLDQAERITPSEILTHPFITCKESSSSIKKFRFSWKTKRPARDHTELPPAVNLVPPPSAQKLCDIVEEDSEVNEELPAVVDKGDKMGLDCSSPSPRATPPAVILVQPASPENRLEIDNEDSEVNEELHAVLDEGDNMGLDCSNPSPGATPPAVILVQPASPENCLELHNKDSDNSEPGSCSPSLRVSPPGVILVQPAAAENTLQQEPERTVQLRGTYTVERRTYTVERTGEDLMPSTHDCTGTEKKKKKKKKRKNCVRRLLSWMKKNFGSCCSSADDDQDK